jgi:hypothetical protein
MNSTKSIHTAFCVALAMNGHSMNGFSKVHNVGRTPLSMAVAGVSRNKELYSLAWEYVNKTDPRIFELVENYEPIPIK